MSLSFKGFLLVRLNLFKRHLGFLIQQKKKERKKYTKRVYFEIGYILILERVLRRSVKKRISQYYPACQIIFQSHFRLISYLLQLLICMDTSQHSWKHGKRGMHYSRLKLFPYIKLFQQFTISYLTKVMENRNVYIAFFFQAHFTMDHPFSFYRD